MTVPSEARGSLTGSSAGVARGTDDLHGSPSDLSPAGLRHRRRVRAAKALAPALVAAGSCFALGGFTSAAAAWATLLALALLAPAGLLRNFAYPHNLLPVSRFVVAVIPVLAGSIFAALVAALGAPEPEAATLVPALALAAIAAIVVEVAGRRLLEWRPLRIAVLGSSEFAAALKRELQAGSAESVEVIGWLNPDGVQPLYSGSDEAGGVDIDSIRAAIMEHEVDLLIRGNTVDGQGVSDATYEAIAQGCLGLPVRLMESTQLYEQLFGHVPIGAIGSNWFLYLMHPRFESTSPRIKRVFDLVLAALGSVFAAPLIAIAALAIKLQDGGPVFYRQERVGEGGREYRIVKLRTMTVDAEQDGAKWSVAHDPRVTRVGRVLRNTHIDELPQLFNVIRGDMTLVGPRPERPEMIAELENLIPYYQRRLLVKPGVTGWAQVRCGYAGTELGTAWKLSHDLFYLKHRSLFADLLIILETMAVALKDSHRPLQAPQAEFLVGGEPQA